MVHETVFLKNVAFFKLKTPQRNRVCSRVFRSAWHFENKNATSFFAVFMRDLSIFLLFVALVAVLN